jgi:hypothetical protein
VSVLIMNLYRERYDEIATVWFCWTCNYFSTTPELTQAISLGDGDNYIIDYTVTDGLDITNTTTVTLEAGANIFGESSIFPGDTVYAEFSALNINDGLVQGNIYSFSGDVAITGGTINGNLNVTGGSGTISGGTIDAVFSESLAHLDISGGTFGSINTISGSYDIAGGTFLGLLGIDYDLSATMTIKGGNYLSGFSYYGGSPLDSPIDNFIFYGDLILDTPTLVGMNGEYPMYETMINGTLMDGTVISQSIGCTDLNTNNGPCERIAIVNTVPIPPSLWFFGSGLLGLIGIARRRNVT